MALADVDCCGCWSLANRFRGCGSSGSSLSMLIILDRLAGTWRGSSETACAGVELGRASSFGGPGCTKPFEGRLISAARFAEAR